MNRLTRITAILIQIQSKKVITAKEIAERFEISLRTVYRDIKTLQDAGVPIGSENGVGYFIVDGYRLPPISINEEEANSLMISETFIKQQGDKSLCKNFNSLLIKLKATLKKFQKESIELLSARTLNFNKGNIIESNWLSDVLSAISSKMQLKITYNSLYKKELTERKIEPQALCFINNVWIAIAFCHLRGEVREFRLDRIIHLSRTLKPFDKLNNFNLQEYFESFQT
jgi:predicted DNA-binding transcriptional regulator YafY